MSLIILLTECAHLAGRGRCTTSRRRPPMRDASGCLPVTRPDDIGNWSIGELSRFLLLAFYDGAWGCPASWLLTGGMRGEEPDIRERSTVKVLCLLGRHKWRMDKSDPEHPLQGMRSLWPLPQ